MRARSSAPVQTGSGAHQASCTKGTGSFPGVESGRGVTLTPNSFSCRDQKRVELYLYSPYGPYGLYRPSVLVQYSYTSIPPIGRTACKVPQCLYSTAITLLPLRAVRPAKSLNACTVQLYLYSHYGPYGLCRASVPVQYSYNSLPTMGRTDFTDRQCLYSTGLPLLPLWAIQPLQNLRACTVQLYLYSRYGPYGLCRPSVPVQYSYTSTPPMGRTACTDPQCLYKGVLFLTNIKTRKDHCTGIRCNC